MSTTIQTSRLSLRAANQLDEPFLDELRRRPEVAHFIGSIRVQDTNADRIFPTANRRDPLPRSDISVMPREPSEWD